MISASTGSAVRQAASSDPVQEMNRWLLESLDIVVSLGGFRQGGLGDNPTAEILGLIKPALRRVVGFQSLAFLMADRDQFDFPAAAVRPSRGVGHP